MDITTVGWFVVIVIVGVVIVIVGGAILGALAWISRIRNAIRIAIDRLIHSKYVAIEDPTTHRMIRYRMKVASGGRRTDEESVYRELVAYLNDPSSKRSKHLVYINREWQPE
jgi:hypothetical protein